jgi:hypothetical protein
METRVYPVRCRSALCGQPDCVDCSHLPALIEFKEWIQRTGARVADPVWSPTVYQIPEKK